MPYSINWYIENELIFAHCWGILTPEEFRELVFTTTNMVENSPRHLVHAITDVGDITEGVPLKSAMGIVREIGSHPRAGWTITIREKSMLNKMVSAMSISLLHVRTRTFNTMDEAVEHLQQMDKTLSWHKANELILPKEQQ